LWENRNRHWKKTLLILLTTDEVLFQREDELDECQEYRAAGDCTGGQDPFYVRLYWVTMSRKNVPSLLVPYLIWIGMYDKAGNHARSDHNIPSKVIQLVVDNSLGHFKTIQESIRRQSFV
jgi:hypothetical protein